ncbi:MAG: family 43 glycosylhydrolase [Clostridia bacterium]|nr:family 43 glycosylhydrolase [Clostridia bacterium]
MKLKFDIIGKAQPDPFIFEDNGKFYIYVTANDGVEAYSADDVFGEWKHEGVICSVDGWKYYWAPCMAKIGDKYYLYFSCQTKDCFQYLHVAESESPLGPFTKKKCLYERFSIDAHVVETKAGIFLWYAEDNCNTDRVGTRIFVDRLLDPMTPANICKEVIVPSFDEEIFKRNRFGDGKDWHTLEGPFWFREGEWQYVMFSGACFENETYHIGYAAAKSDEEDLTKVDFIKHTDGGKWVPTMFRSEVEEGVGHHSVIKLGNDYYAVYHGRDVVRDSADKAAERRTARICKLNVKDGIITAEQK